MYNVIQSMNTSADFGTMVEVIIISNSGLSLVRDIPFEILRGWRNGGRTVVSTEFIIFITTEVFLQN